MPIRYRCRHCAIELGTLPFDGEKAIQQLHQLEIGEIDDYIEKSTSGETIVHIICEQCEDSLRRFPDYYSLKQWLQ